MKLKLTLSIILLIFTAMTSTGYTLEDTELPLVIDRESAIEFALSNNDLVRAAEMMVISAKADGKSQYAPFQPQLTTDYSYTRIDKAPSMVFDFGEGQETIPTGNADNFRWSLNFVFPIYAGGAKGAIKGMMKINESMAKNNLESARHGISFGALQAYFGVLSTLNLVNVREASFNALETSYQNALKWQREGKFSNSEVLQIEVAKNRAQMDYKKANDMYDNAVKSFMQILSIPMDIQYVIQGEVEPPENPGFDKGYVIALASANNTDIIGVSMQIDMLEKQYKLSDSARKPSLNFVSAYTSDGDTVLVSGSDLGGDHNQLSATLQLSWSIYDSGKVSQEKLKIRESVEAMKIQRKDSIEKLMIDVDQKITGFNRAMENVGVTRGNLESAQENFRIVNARFTEGLERSTDLLNAETMLSGAKLEYQQSIYDAHIALANIAFLAGFESTREFLDAVNRPVNIEQSVDNGRGE